MAVGAAGGCALRFTVLGPVGVWRGGERLDAGSPQQRALLAVLLLRGGRVASVAELVDALWGEDPPATAVAALRTYAFRIRKALGPDADVLVSESGGYALRVEDENTDLGTAERLAREAEQAQRCGGIGRARELLRQALGLWSGDPLAGVPGPYCAMLRTRLEEQRLALLERRLALDLESGLHAQVVAELTTLTATYPLRERLRELLMLALYRGGRQGEALAVYADTRRLLAEELGADPSRDLSELHQRILRADPGLAALPDGPRDVPDAVVRPAQLPADLPDVTGHKTVVEELRKRLVATDGQGVVVSAVSGVGGVGKTTLAVHVAHSVRPQFPDGQLYVDLQGAGSGPAMPEAVLGAFLRVLGTPSAALPQGVAERAALYRSVLAGRRVLVLLDNARDAAQVRPLLPGTPGCAVLITSRTRMTGLAGAHLVDLDVMPPQDALTLFARITGAEDEAALEVVAACGYLPLAIRVAASRLAARRSWTVTDLARKLADEGHRLRELRAGDIAVTATFELGYRQLTAAQARAFRLLGLPDGPDISLSAAAAVLGSNTTDSRELLETLVDTSLLQSPAPDRYRLHDLVRLYARACAERDETPEQQEAARSRLLDFYLATTAHVYMLVRPGDPILDHIEPTRWPGLQFHHSEPALQWLFTEAKALLACAAASTHGPALRRAADLMLVAKDLAETGSDAQQYAQVNARLLTAAQQVGDARTAGRLHCLMINIHLLVGRFQESENAARAAWEHQLHCSDLMLTAQTLNDRGILASVQGRHSEAETCLHQALDAFRRYGNQNGVASVLANLSRLYLDTGRVADAVALAERALATYRTIGATLRLTVGHYSLALALAQAGRTDDALDHLSQALPIFQHYRHRFWETMTYWRMAQVHLAAGRPTQAVGLAEQALAASRDTGNNWVRANSLSALGHALQHIKHPDRARARACWQEALTIYEQLGAPEVADVRAWLTGDPGVPAGSQPTSSAQH
ncbi:AfsR family transcriptional regulator [Streptomyces albofaciens JCM 4342]|uniref:AfsR/SARP family transcriptional regulator n=1 Tax=Streptomyces albofaciens TaxID=66866 RepID=UPI00123C6E87|nr:BTAD domain-containing putative transcriptional regulator [Streptomyces albofaciens]KAA6224054.1 AfsR family transcriptional regulator [Streptomyces albofaciens JCM 4342]